MALDQARVLKIIEGICLVSNLVGDTPEAKNLSLIYRIVHSQTGTVKCPHPDWEKEALETELQLIKDRIIGKFKDA